MREIFDLASVGAFVARPAKRTAIGYVKPQVRIIVERIQVMSVHHFFGSAAIPAPMSVALIDGAAPAEQLGWYASFLAAPVAICVGAFAPMFVSAFARAIATRAAFLFTCSQPERLIAVSTDQSRTVAVGYPHTDIRTIARAPSGNLRRLGHEHTAATLASAGLACLLNGARAFARTVDAATGGGYGWGDGERATAHGALPCNPRPHSDTLASFRAIAPLARVGGAAGNNFKRLSARLARHRFRCATGSVAAFTGTKLTATSANPRGVGPERFAASFAHAFNSRHETIIAQIGAG